MPPPTAKRRGEIRGEFGVFLQNLCRFYTVNLHSLLPPSLPSFDVVNKMGQGHVVQGREEEALGKDRARG